MAQTSVCGVFVNNHRGGGVRVDDALCSHLHKSSNRSAGNARRTAPSQVITKLYKIIALCNFSFDCIFNKEEKEEKPLLFNKITYFDIQELKSWIHLLQQGHVQTTIFIQPNFH